MAFVIERKLTKLLLREDKRQTISAIIMQKNKFDLESKEILKLLNIDLKSLKKKIMILKEMKMSLGIHPTEQEIEEKIKDGSLFKMSVNQNVNWIISDLIKLDENIRKNFKI